MTGKRLLDTNIMIALFSGDLSVQAGIEQAAEVFVPTIVLGEMYYGAEKSAHGIANISRLNEFADASTLLSVDGETARHYGRIKNTLRARGRPLPENDLWIAAIARRHSLTVVTRDKYFLEIDDLAVARW